MLGVTLLISDLHQESEVLQLTFAMVSLHRSVLLPMKREVRAGQ